MSEGANFRQICWDMWRIPRKGPEAIAVVQRARLADMVAFARTHSPFYRRHYQDLPADVSDLRQLPPVTKPTLMANFDDWVTDPEVTRAGVDAFIADRTLVGHLFLGRYLVAHSSGSTGVTVIFLSDSIARAVGAADHFVRDRWTGLSLRDQWAIRRRGRRTAAISGTDGHYGNISASSHARMKRPREARRHLVLTVGMPVSEMVEALNRFQPATIAGYPTVWEMLAHEQVAGRLRIDPVVATMGSEQLKPHARQLIASTFNCRVLNYYGAVESINIAKDCKFGRLHVNADWVILEPVDENYKPVPPGQASHTVLLTNLANRVQPVIRYELGDRITRLDEPCPCGSALPTIRVEGRRYILFAFSAPDGRTINVPSVALAASVRVSQTPGLSQYQMIQTSTTTLTIRLGVKPGWDEQEVWDRFAQRLKNGLTKHDLPFVRVQRSEKLPQREPGSGKFRRAWSEVKTTPDL